MSFRRFVPRFSLRTMLIVVTLVAVLLGIWGKRYYDLRARLFAAKQLKQIGYTVSPYFEVTEPKSKSEIEKESHDYQFRWDQFWYGRELAIPVRAITEEAKIRNVSPSDKKNELAMIALMKDLAFLSIYDTSGLTNEDLKFLKNMSRLEFIHVYDPLNASSLSDPLIDYLAENHKLKTASIPLKRLTPAATKKLLDASPELEHLDVSINALDKTIAQQISQIGESSQNKRLNHIDLYDYLGTPLQDEIVNIAASRSRDRFAVHGPTYSDEFVNNQKDSSQKATEYNVSLNLKRFQASTIISHIKELIVEDNDLMKLLFAYSIKEELRVKNCTNLSSLDVTGIKKVSIKNLPVLSSFSGDEFKFSGADSQGIEKFEMADCPILEYASILTDQFNISKMDALQRLIIKPRSNSPASWKLSRIAELPALTEYHSFILDRNMAEVLSRLPHLTTVKIENLNFELELIPVSIEPGAIT